MLGRCSCWIILYLCLFGPENHIKSVEGQILKLPQLPRLRWPSFNRPKKDIPVELKPASTNQDPSVTHIYAGGPPHNPGHQGAPMLPPPPMPHPPPMYPPLAYGNPFGPFARPPNPFVFPNIVAGPPPPPPASTSFYSSPSSSGMRKTRRRRPVYDNDSLEDASTEDEPVYVRVKPRKRRPIVIDEEELLGRGPEQVSSEESPDPPKISYKSRTKPQVVYLDSSREFPSANERRMFMKNEELVQDAPSYHSPSISALHASIGSGGYQLNSRHSSRPSQPELVFVNNLEGSTGPGYSFEGSSNQKFRSSQSEYPGHFVLQNIRSVDQQEQSIFRPQSNGKPSFISESSTNAPTIRIVLNSMNQEHKLQGSPTTPNPTQHNQAQIPSPQTQSSMSHFQMFEPTQTVFHDKGFQFGSASNSPWSPPPASPAHSQNQKVSESVKVARRSFPTGNFPLSPPSPLPTLIEPFIPGPPLPPPPPPPTSATTVFMEKASRKRSPPLQDQASYAQKNQQIIEFSCAGRRSGYYANRQYKCQIYHQCSKRTLTQTFMCPNGTAFNEKQKLCERAQKVACVPEDNRQKNRPMLATTEVPQISSRMDTGSGELIDMKISTPPTSPATVVTTTAAPVQTKYSTSISYSHRVSSSSSSSKTTATSATAKH